MFKWLHEKTYRHALITNFFDLTGLNIVALSESEIGKTKTKILIEEAYKNEPNNPLAGAVYIANQLQKNYCVSVEEIISRIKINQ